MPRAARLEEVEIAFDGQYFPSLPALSPRNRPGSIRRGSNVWRDPGGKIRVANGLLETSSTNVGARIFAANIQRATIAGGLTGNRLPYAGLLRHDNACIFFVSENTGSQVYLNEAAVTGMTTSSSAGRLRVAIPDGVGGYTTVDAGFEKPVLPIANVAVATSVDTNRNMNGNIGVALAPWRTKTNAIGPPSDIVYSSVTASTGAVIRITLPAVAAGQDGWIYCGTKANDKGGTLRVVRYIRMNIRGTFTATNGSPTLTAGIDTQFTRDLYRSDRILIDGGNYNISSVDSDTQVTLTANFTGLTGSGKTATISTTVDGSWLDTELGDLIISNDTFKPPRCAGVLSYSGRVFVWGCFGESASSPTGPMIFPTIDANPEHVVLQGIRTASGSDLVNVLAGDGPLYLMTTTSLEVIDFTGGAEVPFRARIVAEPGFMAATNGLLYTDYFYGYNGRPLRTRARENIDTEFAKPVWSDMDGWNPERVMVAIDPKNQAVLYIHDDGAASEVIPWMTQQEQWGPPLNFDARIIDTQVVNGALYLTYLSGGNYRVQQWEGGSGIGGTRYIASQYLDPGYLLTGRIKQIVATGKIGSVSVFAATADADPPDVSNLGAAADTFTMSDTSKREPAIFTNIPADAAAFRVDFASNDGHLDKLVVAGLPHSERR
jgi:hypothetical protein